MRDFPFIVFKNVSKFHANSINPIIDNISLTIQSGETIVLVGPSGSGKTTILKMLNGLIEPTSGHIFICGKDIKTYDEIKLRRHFSGYVMQTIGLFPHMTVQKNLEIILSINKVSPNLWASKIHELLTLVHLEPSIYLTRYPDELSGGEQQRVGIARALAADTPCLLMDEPFSALDGVTRRRLQKEILNIKNALKKTIVFVTHEISEAFKLADRIAVIQKGKIIQVGTKEQLIHNPQSSFIEKFLS